MERKHTSYSNIPKPVKGLLFVAFIALLAFVIGHVIKFLWNEILVEATDVKELTFWKALGLFALSRILFGGFRFGHREKWQKKKEKWQSWKAKWGAMSEEERSTFKQKWKERCRTKSRSTNQESEN